MSADEAKMYLLYFHSRFEENLVICQRQKAPKSSAFNWVPNGNLVSIGKHFETTRVVHLSKRTATSLNTESDRGGLNH